MGAFLFPLDMKKLLLILFLLLAGCSDFGTNPKDIEITEDVSYKDDIQPMFNSSCFVCHGGNGGLILRTYEDLMKGTSNNGPVIIPNDGAGSLIVKKLMGTAPGARMPREPATKWSDSKIDLVKKWIDQGALNN